MDFFFFFEENGFTDLRRERKNVSQPTQEVKVKDETVPLSAKSKRTSFFLIARLGKQWHLDRW